MRVVIFCHSLRSCWNHGNAHFLRGVAAELLARGHEVRTFEPRDAWSAQNLASEHGEHALDAFREAYPTLDSVRYDPSTIATHDLDLALDGADLVLVHEWNAPALVKAIGLRRARGARFRLLFHDTHHRSVTDRDAMSGYALEAYDGVLAFGDVIREVYVREGWSRRAFTWHEAADVRVFKPLAHEREGDVVWIGNWGDEERTRELHEFLLEPVKTVGARARVHGVRYPEHALAALRDAGIDYRGWLPNHEAPRTFARFAATVHVPRRPYVEALPGIPTIRVFEALACGIPLVSAPWRDVEGLFSPGEDFLVARDGAEMTRHLRTLLSDRERADAIADRGLRTVLARHTCAHRVDELLAIARTLGVDAAPTTTTSPSPGATA